MKTALLAAVCLLCCLITRPLAAQTKAGGVPAFKLLQTNGKFFTAKDLDQTKPVVLIYFSPDCDHCQKLLDGVFKNMASFKNTQLVLATFKSATELALFERQFHTALYPNVKTGTEGTTFFLRYHYNIQRTPFTVVYNWSGALACSFTDIDTPVAEIVRCVKKLK